MDGTLVDTERVLIDIWEAAARDLGYPMSRDVMLRSAGVPSKASLRIMEQAYPDYPHSEIYEEVRNRFHPLRYSGDVPLKPGAKELLQALQGLGIPAALCTNTAREPSIAMLTALGLAGYFSATVCGGETVGRKPAPDPYLRAASLLAVPPAECLAVEDSPNGARSVLAAGMKLVIVPDLAPIPDDLACKAIIVPDLMQVLDFL